MELGRVDICVEVSMLSSHLSMPQKGHLEQLFNIFTYLKKHTNSKMVIYPSEVDFDSQLFPKKDWSFSIYTRDGVELKEAIPPDMP